jgi:catechol 2,3-dioxygenase-like lactoylglutathione lyase family enzyme
MIERFDHIVLTVADIERAVAFYVRVLGMRAVSFGERRRAVAFGRQKINLQTLGQESRNHAATGSGDLCLVSGWPMQRVLAHLEREHVSILEGPVERAGALGPMQSVYFNDPDDNLVEVSVYR